MRTAARVGLIFSFLFFSSCSLVGIEAGYPGGNLGYASDRKILFAQGHDQRVQRYLVTLALLAPLISETAATPIEAKLSAERINAIYTKLGILRTAANRCRLSQIANSDDNFLNLDLASCDVDEKGLDANALAFESVSFDVAKSLNNALKQAYDNLNIRARITTVTALSPTDVLKTVLRARHLLPIAMKYFATYRDVTGILSASVLESCVAENRRMNGGENPYLAKCKATGDLVTAYLKRGRIADDDVAKKERPIRAIYQSSQDVIHEGLNWQFSKKHVAALIFHVDRACLKLAKLQEIDDDKNVTDCRLSGSKAAKSFYSRYKS